MSARLMTLLNPVSLVAVFLIASLTLASGQDSSFQSQFSSPVYFGLAVAGISLGAAITAALIGLLIFCLVRRRRKRDRMRKSQVTQAKQQPRTARSAAGLPGAKATDLGGRITLPIALSAPATTAATNGTAGTSGSSKNGATSIGSSSGAGGGGSGGNSAKMMGQYVNPAFDSTESVTGGSAGRGGPGGAGLYRHSSALRPIQYSSIELSTADKSLHSLNRIDLSGPSITHSVVRTSPADTATRQQRQQQQQQQRSDLLLDPRQYLSDLNLSDRQKRLSLVSDMKLGSSSLMPQQQQQQHLAASNSKRHSYAEQRATYNSSVELVSGQVFATPAASSLPRQTTHKFPRQTQALPTQLEEPSASVEVAGLSKLKPLPQEEGPSFPVTRAVPTPIAQTNFQREDSQLQKEQQLKNLHRIDLSGGAGEGAIDDRRSVSSTVLKQEAIKAFEFLDGYDE